MQGCGLHSVECNQLLKTAELCCLLFDPPSKTSQPPGKSHRSISNFAGDCNKRENNTMQLSCLRRSRLPTQEKSGSHCARLGRLLLAPLQKSSVAFPSAAPRLMPVVDFLLDAVHLQIGAQCCQRLRVVAYLGVSAEQQHGTFDRIKKKVL